MYPSGGMFRLRNEWRVATLNMTYLKLTICNSLTLSKYCECFQSLFFSIFLQIVANCL